MTFNPDRRPMFHTSFRTADAPGDPYNRPAAYLDNPEKFVHDQADLAADWPLWSCDWPGGYQVGTMPGPALMFHEEPAAIAFRQRCRERHARGQATHVYLGSVLPNGETFNTRDATTKRWMETNLAPYFEADLAGVFMDYFASSPLMWTIARMNAADFRSFGKRFGGNAIPYDPTGLDGSVSPQVPPERLDDTSLHACAWYAEAGEIEPMGDPGGLWHFDPHKTEARYGFADDPVKFPDVKDAIARVRQRRGQGYVVDLNVTARPEVAAEILKQVREVVS